MSRYLQKTAVGILLLLGLSGGLTGTQAQIAGNQFGGFATDPNAPINIEADSLDVDDRSKTAVFNGNVLATQGDFQMRSQALQVFYAGQAGGGTQQAATADPGAGAQLSRLRASGGVKISSAKDQRATADWAIFEVQKQQITIGGNVVVSQGLNVMRGDKLVVDLKTGRSRFETPGKGKKPGRVRGVFHPKRKPGG